MKLYDLRSDTITKPTDEMRKAMASAEVGDDVYHEDPTVNRLEAMAAELTGKEEAVMVSSGCMGNLIALMIHGGRGKEVLCARESHIIQHEIGAVSAIANTIPIEVPSDRGIICEDELERFIRGKSYDMGESAIIETENTTSGLVYPIEKLKRIKAIAEQHDMKVHLDGARIFNAAVDSGIAVSEYAATCDDITFCLSKGLGAPAGSMLCGTKEFAYQVRRYRKMLGGGMRQVGILAAAGIYALENNVKRLAEDHAHAKEIAAALTGTGWAEIRSLGTNMIFFRTPELELGSLIRGLNEAGILCLEDAGCARIVTNLGISESDVKEICRIISTLEVEAYRK